jgi:BlaI family transcriptional regulator, penicillinase repressor
MEAAMARRGKAPRISAGDMEILSMLWQHGPLTLPEAHERFGRFGRAVAYTTIQTRLNRLAEKGVVRRSTDRPARYEAIVKPEEVSARQMDMLVSKVTRGKIVPLVSHLITGSSLSREEIDELKNLIAEAERQLAREETGDE